MKTFYLGNSLPWATVNQGPTLGSKLTLSLLLTPIYSLWIVFVPNLNPFRVNPIVGLKNPSKINPILTVDFGPLKIMAFQI